MSLRAAAPVTSPHRAVNGPHGQNIHSSSRRDILVIGGLSIYAGLSKPTTAVRLVQNGGAWKPQQMWQNAGIPMDMSAPVVTNGVMDGLTHRNRGQAFAVDAETEKTLWTGPPRQA